jgi:hypothetical protein
MIVATYLQWDSMSEYYHMSPAKWPVGHQLMGNGRDKVDPRIEVALEARRPPAFLSRRQAVFVRPIPDFQFCGLTVSGYVYRVTTEGTLALHDLCWTGEMEMALKKLQYPTELLVKNFPDWSEELLRKCCDAYWLGEASQKPIWECLAAAAVIVEMLSDQPVTVAETKGGWQKPRD